MDGTTLDYQCEHLPELKTYTFSSMTSFTIAKYHQNVLFLVKNGVTHPWYYDGGWHYQRKNQPLVLACEDTAANCKANDDVFTTRNQRVQVVLKVVVLSKTEEKNFANKTD